MTPNITKIISPQFCDWLAPIVNGDIFTSRERLIALLAKEVHHKALEDEFREFFNGYDVLALDLEECEESVLGCINGDHTFSHLKHRILFFVIGVFIGIVWGLRHKGILENK